MAKQPPPLGVWAWSKPTAFRRVLASIGENPGHNSTWHIPKLLPEHSSSSVFNAIARAIRLGMVRRNKHGGLTRTRKKAPPGGKPESMRPVKRPGSRGGASRSTLWRVATTAAHKPPEMQANDAPVVGSADQAGSIKEKDH